MFIRTVTKSNSKGSKKYQCHQLVESIRTEKGVRQKLLLCLGRLQLPKEHWPRLVARMKAIIHNQQSLFAERADIEKLAQKYAQLFIEKHGLDNTIDNYQTVDVHSLENHRVRFIGGEYLGTTFFNKLKLAECLQGCGFTQRQIKIAMLLIIGRLVHPGSERHLFDWAQNISGLDELIKTDFSQLSLNSLYKVSDLLFEHKTEIESHLRQRENDLFSLNEIFLYCKSSLKQQKERSMQWRLQQNFEEQLTHIAKSIRKKGGTKRYDRVLERIGRLKEKYKQIARFYQIHVEEKDALASRITWKYLQEQSDQRFSGSYFLRTDRLDLSEKEIWSIYIMLTQLEDSFRTLKTDLQLRPVFHQKENRSDAHIFITLLAYHLLHSVRSSLKEKGIHLSCRKIRDRMSTHCRLTNRLKTKNGNLLFIRKCSEPEDFHKTIYNALNLGSNPCKTKKYRIKICSDP